MYRIALYVSRTFKGMRKERHWLAHQVAVYIDGFNLFYGMRSKGWKRYYWLNVYRLAENLLLSGQQLSIVKYFTAPILPDPIDPDKDKRQTTYLDALAALPGLYIEKGYYRSRRYQCPSCGAPKTIYEEKTTDVNIAVAMITDAYADEFDTAILVSADGDLVRPVQTVLANFQRKRVVVAFPPDRKSFDLRNNATAYFTIGRGVIAKSQLPNQLLGSNGHVLHRPLSWT